MNVQNTLGNKEYVEIVKEFSCIPALPERATLETWYRLVCKYALCLQDVCIKNSDIIINVNIKTPVLGTISLAVSLIETYCGLNSSGSYKNHGPIDLAIYLRDEIKYYLSEYNNIRGINNSLIISYARFIHVLDIFYYDLGTKNFVEV